MTVSLRPMRWWDINDVARLEDELFVDDAWAETMFWSELAQRDTRHYLVADDEGAIVGYAGLCAYAPHEAYVQTIAVAAARQRSGVGRALLQALLEEADRRRCDHVDLEVRADNERAVRLYEQHGFTRIGLRRGYYQPSGADAIVMRRERRR
jgi:ribosomal-protein-alanine N-acetyltransferase